MSIKGIDVSGNNGAIDWNALGAAGDVQFAIAKATEGVTYNDASFAGNWKGIQSAGLVRGAYHYARPDNNNAEDEADHFLAQVAAAGGLEGGDLVALDLEATKVAANEDLHDWTLAWLQRVESQVGFKPLFYSGSWYMTPHSIAGADLAQYPLWFSAWNYTFDSVPAAPADWGGITIHQYSEKGTAAGITGAVDLNCFQGTVADLQLYGYPSGAPASTYTVQPGDSWESIAGRLGVGVGDLMAANPNYDQLQTGMVLNIPTMATA
jgi:lysozyme